MGVTIWTAVLPACQYPFLAPSTSSPVLRHWRRQDRLPPGGRKPYMQLHISLHSISTVNLNSQRFVPHSFFHKISGFLVPFFKVN